MDEKGKERRDPEAADVRSLIRDAIREYVEAEHRRAEPAYKTELVEERKRREQMEKRLNELVEENKKARMSAEEADRNSQIRSELQRLGVSKMDLAFKAVRDDIRRQEDGRLTARTDSGEVNAREYLMKFVADNPELLPARIPGGSGAAVTDRSGVTSEPPIDLDKIRPGMSPEDLDRVQREIARVAQQSSPGF